jgi:hypothetical protein
MMVTLRALGSTGIEVNTCQPAGPDPFGVDEVLYNGKPIGLCNRINGAPLAMTAVVSEAIIDDALSLLDERDQQDHGEARKVILAAHDPRRRST